MYCLQSDAPLWKQMLFPARQVWNARSHFQGVVYSIAIILWKVYFDNSINELIDERKDN